MKKYTVFFISFLLVVSAASVYAQQGGFTGPTVGQAGSIPPQAGFIGPFGPATAVTVAQIQTFPHKAQAVLRGNIVQHLGSDRYLFRDSSGDIVIKIKHNRWWGLSVGPTDLVELGGELKRDKRTGWINYFDGKSIRMAL